MVLQQQRLGGYSRRLDRIREACPDLEIRQATINNEGLVNDVIIINGERVFRFARADWAIELMHREARCLELAKREVDIRLPG